MSGIIDSIRDMGRTWFSWTIGSLLGFFVGILPAAGATPGSLMAYGVAKMTSKEPGNFGKGEVAGVVAPESANNAASTGSLLPMLTLGIPGSPDYGDSFRGNGHLGFDTGTTAFRRGKGVCLGIDWLSLCSKFFRSLNQFGIYSCFLMGLENAIHHFGSYNLCPLPRRWLLTYSGHA